MINFLRSSALMLGLFIVAISTSFAQTNSAIPTYAETDTLDRALLWRLDVEGAEHPSYLFGTIHLIDAEHFLISDSLMSTMNRADRIVFEIDPAEMSNPMVAMQMMMKARMSGDTTLSDLLTDEEYKRVSDHFNKIGLPMMLLDGIKPMFLSILASVDPSEMSGMMGGASGDEEESTIKSYELELDKIARASEKEVGGLESTAFQMSLFDKIPYDAQAKMLMQAIDSPEQDDQLEVLTKVYVSGDIESMYSLSVDEESGLSEYTALMLTDRNKNWIAPMIEQSKAGPVVFAVGAAHLAGTEGVLRLLQREGVRITPVSLR